MVPDDVELDSEYNTSRLSDNSAKRANRDGEYIRNGSLEGVSGVQVAISPR